MNEIVNAEYQKVQERTLPVIASEILQIERTVCTVAVDGAIQIGQKLQEAKEKVEHGQWENWCKENLNYSTRKAQEFMQIADNYGDENSAYSKARMSADFSITKALRLLKVPEEEVENFVEEHDVEGSTVKELEAEIQHLKVQKMELSKDAEISKNAVEALEKENAEAARQSEEYAKTIEGLRAELKKVQERAPAAEDSEEVARLKKELEEVQRDFDTASETLEETAKKLKEEKAKLKEEKAKNYERGEAAGRKAAEETVNNLKAQNEELQKKLANSADKDKMKLGILTNQLQITFNEILEVVNGMNGEDASNAGNALRSILSSLSKRL